MQKKDKKHLLTMPALRTAPFTVMENGKGKCTVTKKLYSFPADTAPSALFAKATNLFVVDTPTQLQVSSSSLNIFVLCSYFLPHFMWHVVILLHTFCVSHKDSWMVGWSADQYLHSQQAGITFSWYMLISIFAFYNYIFIIIDFFMTLVFYVIISPIFALSG